MIEDLRSIDLFGGWSYVVLLVFVVGYIYYQVTSNKSEGASRDFVGLNPPADTSEGWKADPLRDGKLRYWDGTNWTAKIGRPAAPRNAESPPLE
jgi:hypothetical protein